MEGDLDPFEFSLAEALGMTVEEMRANMSNDEYLKWRAFNVWRNAQHELATKEVSVSNGRRLQSKR
jgi:hypothetical protein